VRPCEEYQLTATALKLDARTERTRSALMQAFNALILSRGYDGIKPAEIAEAAGVARSTLYEHFAGKADMLRHSLLPILEPLAGCVEGPEVLPRLKFVLEHIRSSRKMARELLRGRARIVAGRTLSQLVEARLKQVPLGRADMPRMLKATYLSSGILGVVEEWLLGRQACPVLVLARDLQASTHAAAVAMTGKASPV
jgi:AcrR family transcriptional regulator